jgi:bifunctional enzyme CysN/CysC
MLTPTLRVSPTAPSSVCKFIAPFRAERQLARDRAGEIAFREVSVDTPPDVAEARDPKGLYLEARTGELTNFTGIDSPYERPERPEVRIDTTNTSSDEAAERRVEHLRTLNVMQR